MLRADPRAGVPNTDPHPFALLPREEHHLTGGGMPERVFGQIAENLPRGGWIKEQVLGARAHLCSEAHPLAGRRGLERRKDLGGDCGHVEVNGVGNPAT